MIFKCERTYCSPKFEMRFCGPLVEDAPEFVFIVSRSLEAFRDVCLTLEQEVAM